MLRTSLLAVCLEFGYVVYSLSLNSSRPLIYLLMSYHIFHSGDSCLVAMSLAAYCCCSCCCWYLALICDGLFRFFLWMTCPVSGEIGVLKSPTLSFWESVCALICNSFAFTNLVALVVEKHVLIIEMSSCWIFFLMNILCPSHSLLIHLVLLYFIK